MSHGLAARLGLALVHMDQLNWQPGWVDAGNDRLRGLLAVEVAKERWLIEGNYASTMEMRLTRADTVVYLDYSLPLCLWRLIKRIVRFHGRTRPDMPENCPERMASFCSMSSAGTAARANARRLYCGATSRK